MISWVKLHNGFYSADTVAEGLLCSPFLCCLFPFHQLCQCNCCEAVLVARQPSRVGFKHQSLSFLEVLKKAI